MDAGDAYTTVHVTTDPVEGDMLVELLRGEAIAARLVRVSAALIGAPPHIFQIKVDVPAENEGRARELLSELAHVGHVEALDQAPESSAPEGEAQPPARRRPMLAAGAALILPGAGHFHARRPWTANVLDAGVLVCLAILVGRRQDFASNAAFATGVAIMGCDALGGALAARAFNRGVVRGRVRQLANGVGLLVIAALAGTAAASLVALPGWLRVRDLARFHVTCDSGSIVVENRGSASRAVFVDRVGLYLPRSGSDHAQAAVIHSPSRVQLPPGARQVVKFEAPGTLAQDCAELVGSIRCELTFSFAAADSGEAKGEDAALLEASGVCAPVWGGPERERRPQLATLLLIEQLIEPAAD